MVFGEQKKQYDMYGLDSTILNLDSQKYDIKTTPYLLAYLITRTIRAESNSVLRIKATYSKGRTIPAPIACDHRVLMIG